MTTRRGFLGALAASPVLGVSKAEDAVRYMPCQDCAERDIVLDYPERGILFVRHRDKPIRVRANSRHIENDWMNTCETCGAGYPTFDRVVLFEITCWHSIWTYASGPFSQMAIPTNEGAAVRVYKETSAGGAEIVWEGKPVFDEKRAMEVWV